MPTRINIGEPGPGQDELRRLPLFEGLAPDRRAGLATMMGDESHKRGDIIFNQGDYGDALYVIKKGSVRISQVSEDGHELILIVLRTGDFFGDMSLLDGEPRSAAAIAAEDSTLLTLRRTDFMRFLGQNPSAAVRVARRLLELLTIYGREVDGGHLLDVRLTQTELAEMVGTSRVTVNKELSEMESAGVIKRVRRQILVLDIDGLNDLAR